MMMLKNSFPVSSFMNLVFLLQMTFYKRHFVLLTHFLPQMVVSTVIYVWLRRGRLPLVPRVASITDARVAALIHSMKQSQKTTPKTPVKHTSWILQRTGHCQVLRVQVRLQWSWVAAARLLHMLLSLQVSWTLLLQQVHTLAQNHRRQAVYRPAKTTPLIPPKCLPQELVVLPSQLVLIGSEISNLPMLTRTRRSMISRRVDLKWMKLSSELLNWWFISRSDSVSSIEKHTILTCFCMYSPILILLYSAPQLIHFQIWG